MGSGWVGAVVGRDVCDSCDDVCDHTTECAACGGVLCDECWLLPDCPGKSVIGYGQHTTKEPTP